MKVQVLALMVWITFPITTHSQEHSNGCSALEKKAFEEILSRTQKTAEGERDLLKTDLSAIQTTLETAESGARRARVPALVGAFVGAAPLGSVLAALGAPATVLIGTESLTGRRVEPRNWFPAARSDDYIRLIQSSRLQDLADHYTDVDREFRSKQRIASQDLSNAASSQDSWALTALTLGFREAAKIRKIDEALSDRAWTYHEQLEYIQVVRKRLYDICGGAETPLAAIASHGLRAPAKSSIGAHRESSNKTSSLAH